MSDLLTNRWLWVSLLAMLLAQVFKVLLILLVTRRWVVPQDSVEYVLCGCV